MREGFFIYAFPLLFFFLTHICRISQCQTPVIFGVARILVSFAHLVKNVTREECTHSNTNMMLEFAFQELFCFRFHGY